MGQQKYSFVYYHSCDFNWLLCGSLQIRALDYKVAGTNPVVGRVILLLGL